MGTQNFHCDWYQIYDKWNHHESMVPRSTIDLDLKKCWTIVWKEFWINVWNTFFNSDQMLLEQKDFILRNITYYIYSTYLETF